MLDLRGHRAYADRAFRGGAVAAAALVLLVLGLIAVTMTRRAYPVFEHMGLDFFSTSRWAAPESLFGALPFIFGTLFTAAIAVLLAVPISLGVALFVTQVAPLWLKKPSPPSSICWRWCRRWFSAYGAFWCGRSTRPGALVPTAG